MTSGKVDWEITNPKDKTIFKGYVLYQKGKVYRELTYPLNYMNGSLNKKEEVKSEEDIDGPDIYYLQFDTSISGKYTLKLKPENAEGTYKITWLNDFPRK